MPVEVRQEQLEPCKVALDVQIPPEQFQLTLDRVFSQLAKRTQVPGFRPGKAPRRLLERYIDQERVTEMALERVVSEGYRQALEQTGLTPFDEPDLKVEDVEEGKPVSFRVTFPLPPSVKLGEYRGLTFKRMEAQVTDADVDAELRQAAEDAARYEDVDEPAQEGDRVLATVRISIDGKEVPEAGVKEASWLRVGANMPEFDQGLQGITPGVEKVFQFTYPEDFDDEERVGKQAEARVKTQKLQRRVVPEVNDAFAASLGYDNLEALRTEARQRLQARAAGLADSELEGEILREIVRRSEVHYPEELVTRDVADDITAFVRRLERNGITLQQYLESKEMGLQQLEADYAERARPRLANTLALMEIARENDIKIEESDVEEEIRRRAEAAGTEPKVMRRVMEEQGDLGALRNQLFYRRALDFLKQSNTIEEKIA
jgi:trigger factor